MSEVIFYPVITPLNFQSPTSCTKLPNSNTPIQGQLRSFKTISELRQQRVTGIAEGAAEQRVLGVLEGAPEWSEVMDMVSSQVYFWNSTTNEVAWEPPEGSNPRCDKNCTSLKHPHPFPTNLTKRESGTASSSAFFIQHLKSTPLWQIYSANP